MDTVVASFSQSTYGIHQMMMWICIAIVITVYCAMIYAIINHHKSNRAASSEIHSSTKMEIIWTLLSFIILVTLAMPAIQNLLNREHVKLSELASITRSENLIRLSGQSLINTAFYHSVDE